MDAGDSLHAGIGLTQPTLDGYESLNRLEKDGQAEGQKENAVEECAEELRACPAEGKVLGGTSLAQIPMKQCQLVAPVSDRGVPYKDCCKSYHESYEIVQLLRH